MNIPYRRPSRRIDAASVRATIPPAIFYSRELPGLRIRGKYATARCPFHDDRNPSFSVNVESGAYRCHGCGAHGGDVIAYTMARRDLPFRQALDALCADWGIAR